MADLKAWFPKMRRLVLRYDFQCIPNTFPNLEKLEICTYIHPRVSIANILRQNPQVKKLRTTGDMEFLKSIIGYIESLQILDICCTNDFFNLQNGSIRFRNVKDFHIRLSKVDWTQTPKIPIEFDGLEKCELTTDIFSFNENFVYFIWKNPSLKEAKVIIKDCLDRPSIERMKSYILTKVAPSIKVDLVADL